MKHALSALVVAVSLLVPALASADELGTKGDAVFSVDRLFGVTGTHVTGLMGPADHDDITSLSFGFRSTPDGSPFDVPRLAFDYMVAEHVSIGGALGYLSADADRANDRTSFVFAPRVGYAYAFGRVVGIWPRAGFTYYSTSIDNSYDEKGLALTLECPFTFSPASHFAFHVGPTFDVDMFGSRDPWPTGKVDFLYRTFGINVGLLGWF